MFHSVWRSMFAIALIIVGGGFILQATGYVAADTFTHFLRAYGPFLVLSLIALAQFLAFLSRLFRWEFSFWLLTSALVLALWAWREMPPAQIPTWHSIFSVTWPAVLFTLGLKIFFGRGFRRPKPPQHAVAVADAGRLTQNGADQEGLLDAAAVRAMVEETRREVQQEVEQMLEGAPIAQLVEKVLRGEGASAESIQLARQMAALGRLQDFVAGPAVEFDPPVALETGAAPPRELDAPHHIGDVPAGTSDEQSVGNRIEAVHRDATAEGQSVSSELDDDPDLDMETVPARSDQPERGAGASGDSCPSKEYAALSRDEDDAAYKMKVDEQAARPPTGRERLKRRSVLLGEVHLGNREPWTYEDTHVWHLVGGAEVDLRNALFSPGNHRLKIRGVIGDVQVTVPPALPVRVRVAMSVGEVRLFEERQSGFVRRTMLYESPSYSQAQTRLDIEVVLKVGDVGVRRG